MAVEPLELLTEEVLREAIGAELVDRAYLDLAKNKVIQRTRHPENEISARWDYQPNSPEMRVGFQDDDLLTLCTCYPFRQEGMCMHIAGLLVAWASQRDSFVFALNEEGPPGQASHGETTPQRVAAGQTFDVVENFRQIMNMLTVGELREIARRRGVPISGIRKEPIVDSLARAFAQKDKFIQNWQMLSAPARLLAGLLPFLVHFINPASLEQAAQPLGLKGKAFTDALDELKESGWIVVENYGAIHYPAVLPIWAPPEADFTQLSVFDPQALQMQPARAPQSFYQAITRLMVLIQASPERYQSRVNARIKDMRKRVPGLEEWPVESKDLEQVARDPQPYQYIQQHGLHINPTPSPVTSEARLKLSEAMQAAPEEVDFIIRLLQSMKVLQSTPGKPVRAAPNAMMNILRFGALQYARQLFAAYANLQGWAEIDLALARSNNFRLILRNYNQGNYNLFTRNMAMLRERLVLLIRRFPAGQWYALKDLALRASLFPFYPLLRGVSGFGYFEINGRKMNVDRPEDGQELLSRILEALLSGPLYWQGAVDLAWEKAGKDMPAAQNDSKTESNRMRVAGFRITDLGSALLAHPVDFEMPKSEPGAPAVEFTKEEHLLLHLQNASGNLIELAVLLGDVEVNSEGAVLVRPTLLGAGRAFEAGWSAERILEVLESEAGEAAPGGLAARIRIWWLNFGRVQIYQDVALIEFNDDYALNELLAGTSLSRYLLYRFSPRLIAIRPEGTEELRSELVKKGYTPKTAA